MEQFVLNKSLLSVKEAQRAAGLCSGNAGGEGRGGAAAAGKLSSLFGAEREDWIEVDFSPWTSSGELGKYFQLLKEAIKPAGGLFSIVQQTAVRWSVRQNRTVSSFVDMIGICWPGAVSAVTSVFQTHG